MAGASFTLTLVDRASGPAGKVAGAIGKIQSMLGLVGKAGMAGPTSSMQSFGQSTSKSTSALSKLGGMAKSALKGLANITLEATKKMAGLGKELGISMVKHVGESAVFLQRQGMAFEMLAGGPEQGKKAFKEARDLALKYGLDMKGTIDSYRKLLAMQFSPEMASQLITMSADLQAIGVHGEEAQRVIMALSQIKGKGRLQGEELLQLAESGISTELVYKNLAKAMGKTVDQARAAVAAGKVTSEQGIEAIKQTVLQKTHTHALGEAAAKAGKTGEGMWNRLKGRGELMLMGMAEKLLTRLGPQLEGAFGQIDKLMSGKEGRAFVDSMATGIGALAEQIPKLIPAFGQVLTTLGNIAGSPAFSQLISSIGSAAAAIGPLISRLLGPLDSVVKMIAAAASGLEKLFSGKVTTDEFVDAAADSGLVGTRQLKGLRDSMKHGAPKTEGMAEQAANDGNEIGAALGRGMTAGIGSQSAAVAAAAAALGAMASAAAASALEVHSPSRVFERIGAQTAAGMVQGMSAGEPRVATASARMVMPRLAGLAGGAPNNTFHANSNATINISGAGDPQAVAAAVRQIMADELAGAFEQIAIQVSGAA